MKTKFLALLLLVTYHSSIAGNAVVAILDASQNPLTGVRCIVTTQNFPQPASNGVAVQWRTGGYTTDGTGSFTISNAVPSSYHVQPVNLNLVAFNFTMPATNGTIYVQNNLWFTPPPNLSTNYPTFAQGDQRWGNPGAVTNVNNATGTNVNLSGTFSGTLNAPYIGNTNSYGVGFTGNGSVGGVIYDSYISPSWQLSGNPSYSSYVNLLGQGFGIGTASPNPAHGVDIVGTAYSTSFATTGTTNQILFGATNTPPTSTNIIAWISVQVSGLTNKFRLGLCQ